MMNTFGGVFGGASFAVFTMGIFLPIINSKGAMIGCICGTSKLSNVSFYKVHCVHFGYIFYSVVVY